MNVNLSELREMVMDRETWRAVIHGVTKSQTRLSNWTELNWKPLTMLITINFRKFFKRWEYQTTLPTSWEICMQVKKQHHGCILLPCLRNFYAEYIMWNARLDEAQAGIKIAGRNINNLRYADDTTLW